MCDKIKIPLPRKKQKNKILDDLICAILPPNKGGNKMNYQHLKTQNATDLSVDGILGSLSLVREFVATAHAP